MEKDKRQGTKRVSRTITSIPLVCFHLFLKSLGRSVEPPPPPPKKKKKKRKKKEKQVVNCWGVIFRSGRPQTESIIKPT